jgi:hypothetical protein
MNILRIHDNGGRTIDRYTVVYDELVTTIPDETMYSGLGMSENPFHPQGFCQHGEVHPDADLGRQILFAELPADCQKAVEMDMQNE